MAVHDLKYAILLLMAALGPIVGDSQLGIRGFPVATTVSTNETALFTCEVQGSGVNWCIDNTCANDGPLPYTSSTAEWKPANRTFYSELRVLVPLYYNNSLVKCCVVESSSVCSPNVTLTVNYKKHVSPTEVESDSSKETRMSSDITPTTAVTAHTWILLTESPKPSSTPDLTSLNNSWLAVLSAPLVLIVLGIIGGAVCCRKHCKGQYRMYRRSEESDIENSKYKEDSSEEEMQATTSMEEVAELVTEHEETSDVALLTHAKLERSMSWPPMRANRRTTGECLPWQSDDISEPSVNHSLVSFHNQLSGDQAITVTGIPHVSTGEVLNISQMEKGAPSLEEQLCVFNRLPQSSPLPQLRKGFSKGHKRVFSCPSSVEESIIVHGNTEYSSMHKPL